MFMHLQMKMNMAGILKKNLTRYILVCSPHICSIHTLFTICRPLPRCWSKVLKQILSLVVFQNVYPKIFSVVNATFVVRDLLQHVSSQLLLVQNASAIV